MDEKLLVAYMHIQYLLWLKKPYNTILARKIAIIIIITLQNSELKRETKIWVCKRNEVVTVLKDY